MGNQEDCWRKYLRKSLRKIFCPFINFASSFLKNRSLFCFKRIIELEPLYLAKEIMKPKSKNFPFSAILMVFSFFLQIFTILQTLFLNKDLDHAQKTS